MIRVAILAGSVGEQGSLARLLQTDPEVEVVSSGAILQGLAPERSMADVQIILAPQAFASQLQTSLLPEIEPGQGVLWLTDDPSLGRSLARAMTGAWGLLATEASPEELLAAVHALHEGLVVGLPALMEGVLTRHPSGEGFEEEQLPPQITGREGEVLQLLSQGLANKQIATVLGISPHTVKYHISSIYSRLGATNRAEAVRLAIRAGLISI